MKGGPSALGRDKPAILVVDDDLATRELFASCLEQKITRLSLLVRGVSIYGSFPLSIRIAAIFGPACELPMWIQYLRELRDASSSPPGYCSIPDSGYSRKRVRRESCGLPEFPQWNFRL